MAPDPYRKPLQEPLRFNDTPETLLNRANTLAEQHNHTIKDLMVQVNPKTATFDNFLLPIARLYNDWITNQDLIEFYGQVSPDEAIRDASRQAAQILNTEEIREPDLSKWVKAIYDRNEELDPESRKFLENKNGDQADGKETTSTDRLEEINDRIDQICVEFDANLNNENSGFWASEAELVGVPINILNQLQKGIGDDEGKLRVTFDWSIGLSIMEYAMDQDFRKKLYLGRSNSCLNNVPLFKEIISLRHEKAIIMGQPETMTFKMRGSLLKNPDAVRKLLPRFRQRVSDIGVLESLKETKRLDTNASDKILYLWDEPYYKRMWLENHHSVDHRKIAEYFPFKSTTHGMLQIFGEMFGLDFQHVIDADVWHEDVELFAVWDNATSGGNFVGFLYVDALPRPGKYRHACCFELQPSFLTPGGDRRYGASALVCNFPKLLEHGQVITLFHELGHGMHQLLSRTKYATFHGTRYTNDFIEIPSVLLEHWCWLPAQLQRLSRHYDTGATIPDDLLNNLVRTKYFVRVLDLFHVALATFDMAVYTPATQKEADEMNPAEIYNKIICEVTGLKGLEAVGEANEFGHGYAIRVHHATGYPGNYYAYISSYCFAEKIWNAIFANDPMNEEAAMRYRRLVLEKGGSQNPLDMLENLLGEKIDWENLCN